MTPLNRLTPIIPSLVEESGTYLLHTANEAMSCFNKISLETTEKVGLEKTQRLSPLHKDDRNNDE